MPYVRFRISDAQRASLLRLARLEEAAAAEMERRKPRRISASQAAAACYAEGYEDMRVRQPHADDDEGAMSDV